MRKFLKIALASLIVAAPLASAQAQNFIPRQHHQGGPGGQRPGGWGNQHHQGGPAGHRPGGWGNQHHGPVRYPKGWGPNHRADGGGYYHGYHGYRAYRPGYRRHSDGLWYPAAAFALGAILGGALNH